MRFQNSGMYVSLVVSAALAMVIVLFMVSSTSKADTRSGTSTPSQGSIVDGPGIPEENFPSFTQVVDNSSSDRFEARGWSTKKAKSGSHGENYTRVKSADGLRAARYKFDIPETDVYSVFGWWPARKIHNTSTRFGVRTTDGVKWSKVDQSVDGGFWVKIGEYEMQKGDRYSIKIKPRVGEGYAAADAVSVVRGVLDSPPEPPKKEVTKATGTTRATGAETMYKASSLPGKKIRPRAIMRRSKRHKNTPYGPRAGGLRVCKPFIREDCSCFTRLVFKKWRTLPDHPAKQWKMGRKIRKSNLRAGDLVFFKEWGRSGPITHVGIYAGNGYLWHASSYWGKVVRKEMKWIHGYHGAKRLRYR